MASKTDKLALKLMLVRSGTPPKLVENSHSRVAQRVQKKRTVPHYLRESAEYLTYASPLTSRKFVSA